MHWALGRRLDDILNDPGNGFGVVRLIAALAVVFSHSFYLLTHDTAAEPLYTSTGFTLGQHAVHVFFVLSGCLVAASLDRAPTMRDFITARALRIFPGLIICTLVTAFVIGPLTTSLTLSDYLSSAAPIVYVAKTVGLITGNAALPGVFVANPVAGEVNIPVWTLKYEVVCYLMLAGLALAGVFRSWEATTFVIASIAAAVVVGDLAGAPDGRASSLTSLSHLGLCFTIGVLVYLLRSRIVVGPLQIGVVGLAYVLARGTGLELLAIALFTAALVFGLGGIAAGVLADRTRETDLSFGIYIYGWPIMQLLLSFDPALGQGELVLLALALLFPIAYLSWRFVERPALAFKRRRSNPSPDLGSIGRRITEPRPPAFVVPQPQFDVEGNEAPPPPSRRRIRAALRTSASGRMRVVKP